MAIFSAKSTAPPSSNPVSSSKKSTGPPPPLSPSKLLPPPLSPSFFHGEEYGLPASYDTNILARCVDVIYASLSRISSTTQAKEGGNLGIEGFASSAFSFSCLVKFKSFVAV